MLKNLFVGIIKDKVLNKELRAVADASPCLPGVALREAWECSEAKSNGCERVIQEV
jgi:hypothetical protein